MCNSPELSNKTEYPTFARTLSTHNKVFPTILSILNKFKWNKVAIVTERGEEFRRTTEYMKKEFKKRDIKLTYSAEIQGFTQYDNARIRNNTKYEKEYENAIRNIKKEARSKNIPLPLHCSYSIYHSHPKPLDDQPSMFQPSLWSPTQAIIQSSYDSSLKIPDPTPLIGGPTI